MIEIGVELVLAVLFMELLNYIYSLDIIARAIFQSGNDSVLSHLQHAVIRRIRQFVSLQFLIILSSRQRLCASFRATAVLRIFEMQFNLP